jgi:hypothetical protein
MNRIQNVPSAGWAEYQLTRCTLRIGTYTQVCNKADHPAAERPVTTELRGECSSDSPAGLEAVAEDHLSATWEIGESVLII